MPRADTHVGQAFSPAAGLQTRLPAPLHILPGLINAHDHLEFALFPQLGAGPYPNATAWARDIYHPNESPVREHLRVPKHLRLIWGGLRNLLAGVTTVCHHNPYHPIFDQGFPVRVLKRFAWAHSFTFADVARQFSAAPSRGPFILHLGEGTDAASRDEIFRLRGIHALHRRTVLVHAVALNSEGWRLVRRSRASVIWCPRANLFTLGKTLEIGKLLAANIPVAIATDSPLTAPGDLLDDLHFATAHLSSEQALAMVTSAAARVLGLRGRPRDFIAVREFGAPPHLVVINGRVQLISIDFAGLLRPAARASFSRLEVAGRPPVLVRFDVPALIEQTRSALGGKTILLGGREVLA